MAVPGGNIKQHMARELFDRACIALRGQGLRIHCTFALLNQNYELDRLGRRQATGRLVFWFIVSELDRKPERELGKLEEVREGKAVEVHTAGRSAGSIHE